MDAVYVTTTITQKFLVDDGESEFVRQDASGHRKLEKEFREEDVFICPLYSRHKSYADYYTTLACRGRGLNVRKTVLRAIMVDEMVTLNPNVFQTG